MGRYTLNPLLSRIPSLSVEWAMGKLEGKKKLSWRGHWHMFRGARWWDAGRPLTRPCPPPTGHRGNSRLRLDLLVGICWRSSLRWGDTDSQQGLERR